MKNKFLAIFLAVMLVLIGADVSIAACYGDGEPSIDIIDWKIVEMNCIKIPQFPEVAEEEKTEEEGEEEKDELDDGIQRCDKMPKYRTLDPYNGSLDFSSYEWLDVDDYADVLELIAKIKDEDERKAKEEELKETFKWHNLLEVYIHITSIDRSVIDGSDRRLFSMDGGDLNLLWFNPKNEDGMDLFREKMVRLVEQYTITYKIVPIYSDNVEGESEIAAIESAEDSEGIESADEDRVVESEEGQKSFSPYGSPIDVTNVTQLIEEPVEGKDYFSFFVCTEHYTCKGCKLFVGYRNDAPDDADLVEYLKGARINDYCAENHACLFFWTTCVTNNMRSFNNKLTHRFDGAPEDYVLYEMLECMYYPRYVDPDDGVKTYFCEDHTCTSRTKGEDDCIAPIVGVRYYDDGEFKMPKVESIYQGTSRKFYSNFCVEHFCWERYCQGRRNNPQSVSPNMDDKLDEVNDFAEYCDEHHDADCTINRTTDGSIKDNGCKEKVTIEAYEADGPNEYERTKHSYEVNKYRYLCPVHMKDPNAITDSMEGGEDCGHTGYVPNSVTFEKISDSEHIQRWKCSVCGADREETYSHTRNINGKCVCEVGSYPMTDTLGGSGLGDTGLGGLGNDSSYEDLFEDLFGDNNEEDSFEEEVTYIATFKANGGKGKMESQEFTEGVAQRLNANKFTRDGYEFKGWAFTSKGEAVLPDRQLTILRIDVTLYAVWEVNEYIVTFKSNGGKGEMENQIFEAEEVAPLNANEFTKEGYRFVGWATERKGEVEYEDEEDFYAEEDITLYAIWEENEFIVTFNANGGEGEMEDQVFILEEEQELNKNEFVKEGYKFLGWSTEKNGEVEYEDEGEYLIEENLILYAIWEQEV